MAERSARLMAQRREVRSPVRSLLVVAEVIWVLKSFLSVFLTSLRLGHQACRTFGHLRWKSFVKNRRIRWRLARADSRPLSCQPLPKTLAHLGPNLLLARVGACGRKCSYRSDRRRRLSTRMRASQLDDLKQYIVSHADIQGFSDLGRIVTCPLVVTLASAIVPTSNKLPYFISICLPLEQGKERDFNWMPSRMRSGHALTWPCLALTPPSPKGIFTTCCWIAGEGA